MSCRAYAGIGNRVLPAEAAVELTQIASAMARLGWMLRTGGADGADRAFEAGGGPMIIMLPSEATEAAIAIAAQHHPAWGACNEHARRLLGRNVQIVLGANLDDPVALVLAYTVNEERGGTALALRVARAHGIPVVNLARGRA